MAVTHDRYFLDNVAGWILELDRGQGIPFEGNYSEWLKAKDKRLAVSRTAITQRSLDLDCRRCIAWSTYHVYVVLLLKISALSEMSC